MEPFWQRRRLTLQTTPQVAVDRQRSLADDSRTTWRREEWVSEWVLTICFFLTMFFKYSHFFNWLSNLSFAVQTLWPLSYREQLTYYWVFFPFLGKCRRVHSLDPSPFVLVTENILNYIQHLTCVISNWGTWGEM